jgi:hypothetical protein
MLHSFQTLPLSLVQCSHVKMKRQSRVDLGMCAGPRQGRVPHTLRRPRASRPREWHDCRLLTLNSAVTLLNNQLDPCPSHSFRPLTILRLRFSRYLTPWSITHSASFNALDLTHSQAPHHVIPRRGRMLDRRQPTEPVHKACPG